MRSPRRTAKREAAELQAELASRRRDAAHFLREAYERKKSRPGFLDRNTREFVEELIAEVEAP